MRTEKEILVRLAERKRKMADVRDTTTWDILEALNSEDEWVLNDKDG